MGKRSKRKSKGPINGDNLSSLQQAKVLVKRGEYQGALDIYNSLESNIQVLNSLKTKIKVLNSMAYFYQKLNKTSLALQEKDFDAIIEAYKQCLEEFPNEEKATIQARLGIARALQGKNTSSSLCEAKEGYKSLLEDFKGSAQRVGRGSTLNNICLSLCYCCAEMGDGPELMAAMQSHNGDILSRHMESFRSKYDEVKELGSPSFEELLQQAGNGPNGEVNASAGSSGDEGADVLADGQTVSSAFESAAGLFNQRQHYEVDNTFIRRPRDLGVGEPAKPRRCRSA